MPEGYSGVNRPWYQYAVKVGGPALTAPYVDASTGKLTISFVEAVGPRGQHTAVVGTDMHLDTIAQKVNAIRPLSQSFAFLVDGDGNAASDIFRTDRQTGVTLRVSVDDAETQIAADSIEPSVSAEGDVIIDNGASSFVPLSHYLISNQVPALLQDMGHELVVHTVVTGGQALVDIFGEVVLFVPAGGVGGDFGLHKLAHGIAHHVLVWGQ